VGRVNKKIIFEYLSFGSAKAVVVNFSVILVALGIIPTAFWDRTPNICIWRRFISPLIFQNNCPTSGIFADCHCPACGLTHAMSYLLHGNFTAAYESNNLVFVVVGLILFLVIYNLINLKKKKERN